ncbi:hypothetical protein [Neisseria musculi]|uniref:hypothetical protein n=1 Tax=Neisseria musculi TaxID=1815583 RepID=UPI00336BE9DF
MLCHTRALLSKTNTFYFRHKAGPRRCRQYGTDSAAAWEARQNRTLWAKNAAGNKGVRYIKNAAGNKGVRYIKNHAALPTRGILKQAAKKTQKTKQAFTPKQIFKG